MAVAEALEQLLNLRAEHGSITPAEVADTVLAHDLDEQEAEALDHELEMHGAAPEDEEEEFDSRPLDRRDALHHRLAADVPQRGRPLPAAHRGGGGRAREAHRARRHGREGADDQLQPPPRRLDREALPDAGHHARRPRPGGRDRPDPRDREVRLAQGLQVLDVRDLVDSPGRAARRRQQVAHDPDPGARRRARAEGRARASASWSRRSSAIRRPRRSRSTRSCRSRRCTRCMAAARAVASTDTPVGDDGDASLRRPVRRHRPVDRGRGLDATLRDAPSAGGREPARPRARRDRRLRFGLVGDGPASLERSASSSA